MKLIFYMGRQANKQKMKPPRGDEHKTVYSRQLVELSDSKFASELPGSQSKSINRISNENHSVHKNFFTFLPGNSSVFYQDLRKFFLDVPWKR